jgi:hypothetical protein
MANRKTDKTGSTKGSKTSAKPGVKKANGRTNGREPLVLDRRKRILVTLLVDESERQALRGLAEYDHTSQSGWMRKIIRDQARALASDLQEKGKPAVEAFDI